MIKGTKLSLSLQDMPSPLISFKIDTACPFLSLSTVSDQLSLASYYQAGWLFHFTHSFCPSRPGVISVRHCCLSEEVGKHISKD